MACALVVALAASFVVGCSPKKELKYGPIRVGLVPAEDSLGLWVAERDGLAEDAGLDLKLAAFATAQERDAALAEGKVDAVVGDIVSASKMRIAGIPARIAGVLLGASPEEGRFGVAVKPKSQVTSLVQLAGIPVATSKGTLEEYVLESLMMLDGLGPNEIEKKTVNGVQERFDALVSGQLDAAVLPEPYLTLAEKRGAKVISQDTHDVNLSQSCLVVSERYLDTSAGTTATGKLLDVLAEAAKVIDKDPSSFRSLLAEKIPAMKPVEGSYKVSGYSAPALPTLDDVEMVLDWMTREKLQKGDLVYEALVWQRPPAPPEAP